ncbi:hypothetical protein RISK_004918 [Rhodopirellula islandica]|uniref:Uncharacterized protein n=1 Tax=Rhodopirellula islandica TaxID=595434 RepID=A0A0J1B8U0_RHOIS|nr:hypothetical protein RISK_004918 [Rhodopirellula islandica]
MGSASLTLFEVALFARMANGLVQFKTSGLMLAVGQQNRMQKRFKT